MQDSVRLSGLVRRLLFYHLPHFFLLGLFLGLIVMVANVHKIQGTIGPGFVFQSVLGDSGSKFAVVTGARRFKRSQGPCLTSTHMNRRLAHVHRVPLEGDGASKYTSWCKCLYWEPSWYYFVDLFNEEEDIVSPPTASAAYSVIVFQKYRSQGQDHLGRMLAPATVLPTSSTRFFSQQATHPPAPRKWSPR